MKMTMKYDYLLAAMRRLDGREYDQLMELCDFLERTLAQESKERLALGEKQLQGVDNEDEQAWIAEGIAEDIFQAEREFPRILRYSLYVTMMSLTEACIVRLCKVAHRHLSMRDEFDERSSDVIQRGIKYLSDAGVDTSGLCYYRCLVNNLRNIRNAISHAEGRIARRPDEKEIREFAATIPTITIDDRSLCANNSETPPLG